MWSEGTIGIPATDKKYTAVHYWVKHYEYKVIIIYVQKILNKNVQML